MKMQESVARSTYKTLPIEQKEDTKEKCKYLRASHFEFGTDDNSKAVPESKYVFTQKEYTPTIMNTKTAQDIKNSHIGYIFNPNHGGNARTMGVSTYQDKISEQAKSIRELPQREHKNLHRTNFLIGTDKCNFETEANSK